MDLSVWINFELCSRSQDHFDFAEANSLSRFWSQLNEHVRSEFSLIENHLGPGEWQ